MHNPPKTMNKHLDRLTLGSALLALLGAAACSSSDDSGNLTPGANGLEVEDVTRTEGDSGASVFTFTISLATAHASVVTVDYSTVAGSAQDESSGGDFQSASGTQIGRASCRERV